MILLVTVQRIGFRTHVHFYIFYNGDEVTSQFVSVCKVRKSVSMLFLLSHILFTPFSLFLFFFLCFIPIWIRIEIIKQINICCSMAPRYILLLYWKDFWRCRIRYMHKGSLSFAAPVFFIRNLFWFLKCAWIEYPFSQRFYGSQYSFLGSITVAWVKNQSHFLSEFRNLWFSCVIFDNEYLLSTSYPKKEITKCLSWRHGVSGFKLSICRIVFVRCPTCTFPGKIVLTDVGILLCA